MPLDLYFRKITGSWVGVDWREQGLRTGDGQEVGRLPKQEMKRTELGHWDWRGRGGSDLEWVELAVSGRENKACLKI